MPKVSVNILTCDRPELLKKALASVEAQSFRDFELVVFDNSKERLPIPRARNVMLNTSKGEYIAVLDDDDEWTDTDKLAKQTDFLDIHPRVVLLGTWANGLTPPESDEQIRRSLLFRNAFIHSSVLYRRELALHFGGYNAERVLAEDFDLWLRLGKMGELHNLPIVTIRYAPLSNSASNKQPIGIRIQSLKIVFQNGKGYPHYFMAKLAWLLRIVREFFRII